jgi:hypothetical protein
MGRSRVPGKFSRYGLGQTVRKGISDWIPVNPSDGSWLVDDPNSVVNATATTTAGVQFQNNTAAFDHHMDNNEDGGAAYYKILSTDDGTPMSFSDTGWSVDFLIKRQVNGSDNGCINLAICDGPTDRANRAWVGMTYSNLTANSGAGNGKVYYGTQSSMNSGSNSASDRAMINISHSIDTRADDDGNEIIHAILFNHLDSNLALIANGQKSGLSQEYDAGDLVYIMLSSGYDVASTSEPGAVTDNTWKVWYRLNYSPQGLDPEYRVAGRGLDNR